MCKTGHGGRKGEGVAGTNQMEEGSYPEQILPSYWKTNQPTKKIGEKNSPISSIILQTKHNTLGFKDLKLIWIFYFQEKNRQRERMRFQKSKPGRGQRPKQWETIDVNGCSFLERYTLLLKYICKGLRQIVAEKRTKERCWWKINEHINLWVYQRR